MLQEERIAFPIMSARNIMQPRQQLEMEFLKAHHSAIGTFRNKYGNPTEHHLSSRQSRYIPVKKSSTDLTIAGSKELQIWDVPCPETSSITSISPSVARRSRGPSFNDDSAAVAQSSEQANTTNSGVDAPIGNVRKAHHVSGAGTATQAQKASTPSIENPTENEKSPRENPPTHGKHSGPHRMQGNGKTMSSATPRSEPLSRTIEQSQSYINLDYDSLFEPAIVDEQLPESGEDFVREAISPPYPPQAPDDRAVPAKKDGPQHRHVSEEPNDAHPGGLSFENRTDTRAQSQRHKQQRRDKWPKPSKPGRIPSKHLPRLEELLPSLPDECQEKPSRNMFDSHATQVSLNRKALSQVSQPLSAIHDLEKTAAKTLTEALNEACIEGRAVHESTRHSQLSKSFVHGDSDGMSAQYHHLKNARAGACEDGHIAKSTPRTSIARRMPSSDHAKVEYAEDVLQTDQIGMVNAQSFQIGQSSGRISTKIQSTDMSKNARSARTGMRGNRERARSSQGQRRNAGGILSFEEARALHAEDIAAANVPDHIMADLFNKQLNIMKAAQESVTRVEEPESTSTRSTGKHGNGPTSDCGIQHSQRSDHYALPKNGVFFTREDLQQILPRTRRVIDENLRSQLLVEHPDNYSVPELGSQRMPRVSLKSLPEYKTLLKQVEDGLPDFMRAIPAPRYAFSKRKKEHMDPVKVGALPSPNPQALEPLPDPFMVLKGGSGLEGVAKQGYAQSEFDDGVADNYFRIVGETVDAASRWHWFSKDKVSLVGDPNGRSLEFEATEYDKNFPDNTVGEDKGLWMEEKIKQVLVSHWVTNQTANMLKCPMLVDTRDSDFLSGKFPVSGLKYNYQEFPPDLAYRPVTLHYGPINWEDIPQPKLSEPSYLEGRIFNRTAQQAISKVVAKRQKRRAEEKARARRQALRAAERELQVMPAPRRLDSAQQDRSNNIWVPHLKISVRVARFIDIEPIRRIYNYYTCNTIDAPETIGISSGAVKQRLDLARAENYPFLVAVLNIDHGDTPPRKGTLTNIQIQDPARYMSGQFVVGFARARSFNGTEFNCFEDAALLEVFVAPQYCREKIASNLLDRLVACLDGTYKSHQGVPISVEASRPRWDYGWRDTHAHVVKMFYRDIEEATFVGRKKHLEDHFGFFEIGAFPDVCSKDGGQTRYSMSYMLREANRDLRQRPS